MRRESTTKDDAHPCRLSDQIDLVCDQFETELGQGKTPRIEDMLSRVQKEGRLQLLRELIAVEVAFEQALGKPVDFSIYVTRFPEDEKAINELRADFELNSRSPGSTPWVAVGQNNESSPQRSQQDEDVKTVTFQRQLRDGVGNYQLLERIGRGGGGEVYAARHRRLERRDAVKLLAVKDAGNNDVRQRFYREMQSIGRLKHVHIVQAYDAGEVDGVLYLAMELVEGADVEFLSKRIPRMEIADACEIVRQAALGLQHIYEHGMVHRDLKPSNLLLSSSGIKIADLGMALLRVSEPTDDRLTGTFVVMGTADYMAPEQSEGARDVDIRADLYSLGCTLYRMLAGQAPFAFIGRGSILQKLHAHVHDPVPDICTQRSDIPKQLLAILEKLLAKDREQRFSQPQGLAEVLAPLCLGANLGKLLETVSTDRELPQNPHAKTMPNAALPIHATMIARRLTGRWLLRYIIPSFAFVLCIILYQYLYNADSKEHPGPSTAMTPGSHKPVVSEVPRSTASHNLVIPRTVLSGNPSGNSFFQVNEAANKLQLASDDLLMVKLGTLDHRDSVINIAMEVSEVKSEFGQAGVFVAFRDTANPERGQFQLIQLETLSDASKVSRREVFTFHPKTPYSRSSRIISSIPILRASRVNSLNLKLVKGRLHQLTWNTQPGEKLDITHPDMFEDNDLTGVFGVFTNKSVAVFSNFKVDGEGQEFKP